MKTLASSIMILVMGLAIVPVFSMPVSPDHDSASDNTATIASLVHDERMLYVSSGVTASAHLCDEGYDYLVEQLDICDAEYVACLSGDGIDGSFELDDGCDASWRLCNEWARCEAEELCEDR